MHVFAFLVSLLFAALQVQGIAIPSKTLRDDNNTPATPNVPVKLMTANVTLIDAKPGAKTTQSYFHHIATTQSICTLSDQTGGMTDHFARTDDCQELVTYLHYLWLGYWDTWDYDGPALDIIDAGTCAVYISSVNTFNGHVSIGNQDIADAISVAISKFSHNGLVGAAGQMNCNHPSGATTLDWSVQDSGKGSKDK